MYDQSEAEKYAALRAELEADGAIEPEEPQVPEERTIANPDAYEASQQYEPQQYQPEPPQQIPDMMEDPLSHFDGRARQIEDVVTRQHAFLQHRAVMDAVERDEKAFEKECADYWDACRHLEEARIRELERQIPDGKQGDMYAHRFGFRNAAEARAAQLNLDRQQVIAWAMQNGTSPAQVYYELAKQKGYRPAVVPRSIVSRTLEASRLGGDDFDKEWARYAKAARQADQNYRARR